MSERRGSLGIPTLEIGVIIALIGIFVAVLTHQLFYYWELAERTTVEMTINNMRSALRLEMAARLMNGHRHTIPHLAGSNPMNLLHPPDNYLGERKRVDPLRIEPGHWVYDRQQRTLYYVPRYHRHLSGPSQEKLAFLKFVLESSQKSSEISANTDIPQDVRLVSAQAYTWF